MFFAEQMKKTGETFKVFRHIRELRVWNIGNRGVERRHFSHSGQPSQNAATGHNA